MGAVISPVRALSLWSACLCILLSASLPGRAQSPATLQAFEKSAALGGIEDALVGLSVVNKAADGTTQTRHGNGLMLRCDGFVLVPEALFDTRNAPNAAAGRPNHQVTVVLHPGTSSEQRVAGGRPDWHGFLEWGRSRYALGYAVLKLSNVHCPAMRALLPDTLAPGDKLTLVWSHWDEDKQRFLAPQRRPVEVGIHKPPAADDKTPALFRAQSTPLSQPVEDVPAGALVIGPEDLVVGLRLGSGALPARQFANFDSLHLATNCVTALPVSDDAFVRRKRPAAADASQAGPAAPDAKKRARDVEASALDMVAVPGGPVKLPPTLRELQADMGASAVACVAPFLIDRYEVTNGQYWQFWQSLPEQTRRDANARADLYPYGWGTEPEPFPAGMAQVPVLGVRLPGARAYAKWAGKRLPTPYEWCLAAFGPDGGNTIPAWGRKYLQQRNEVWKQIVARHEQYAREHSRLLPQFLVSWIPVALADNTYALTPNIDRDGNVATVPDPEHPSVAEFFHLPWFFTKADNQDAAAWSKETIETLTDPLFETWIDPMYVLPVGSRPYDVSPYGVYDMVMNAKELVAPGPFFPWNLPPRPNWPTREVDRYMDVQWGLSDRLQKTQLLAQQNSRYQTSPGFVPPEFALTRMNDPETILRLCSFGVNPLRLWVGNSREASVGDLNEPVGTPTSLFDARLPAVAENNFTNHSFSRRLHTGTENVRPGSNDYVIADLSAYVTVCAAMDEFNEILRPAEAMNVDMVAGPTHNMVRYPFGETVVHHRVRKPLTFTERWLPAERFGKRFPATSRVHVYAAPDLEDEPTFLNGSWILHTGSFPLWRGMPRHYHQEMGHPLGVDHDRPYSDQDRPLSDLHPTLDGKGIQGTIRPLAPDTFLVPGGFRCAR